MLPAPTVKYGAGSAKVQNALCNLTDVKKFMVNGKVQKIPVLVLFDSSRGWAGTITSPKYKAAKLGAKGA